jgi:hypothetical protein
MKNSTLIKIEETYLLIFKVVLLVVLTLALIGCFGLIVKGVLGFTEVERIPEPIKTPPSFNVKFDDFLNKIEKENKEKKEQESIKALDTSLYNRSEPVVDPADNVTDNYTNKLWELFEIYQNSCKISSKIEKEDFLKNFPKSSLKDSYNQYGQGYLSSMEEFMTGLLTNKKTIELCVNNEGKGQIFMRGIGWHRQQYANWSKEKQQFEQSERERIDNFKNLEKLRIAGIKMLSLNYFKYALISFCIFMSITLLLIISKIEYNLRSVAVIDNKQI